MRLAAGRGDPRAALEAAGPLLDDAPLGDGPRTTIALGAIEALISTGRTGEALGLVEDSLPAARRLRDALPHAEVVLVGMRAMALRVAGRLVEATEASEQAYAELLPRRVGGGHRGRGNSLGLIWLARGRPRTALRFCRESAALLRDGDAVGMLPFALAGVAQAAAQAGDAETAREAVEEMERTPLGHKGFAIVVELARAWSAAAAGELSRARELARGAADLAVSRGQDAYAVHALHELARLGDPAAAAAAARPRGAGGRRPVRPGRHRARRRPGRPRRDGAGRGRGAVRRHGRPARRRRGGGRRGRRAPRRGPRVQRARRRRARRRVAGRVRGRPPADDARRAARRPS